MITLSPPRKTKPKSRFSGTIFLKINYGFKMGKNWFIIKRSKNGRKLVLKRNQNGHMMNVKLS